MITSLSYYTTCADINSNTRDLVPNVRKLSFSIDNNVAISRSELEKMKKEEDYQSFDMVIRELIHEHGDRRIPEASELRKRREKK
jgi:hypothetical protein